MFGYSTPALQKLAIRLISQCALATGCERNWSTFAFIHTKVRNHLTYEKLHKLVYVNYNLRIQNNIDGGSRHDDDDDDDDPFNQLMELTLVDPSNPIREWMERARSTVQPELDEESPDTDALIPSVMVIATAHPRDLQRRTGSSSILEWARKNIGDSHRGKTRHMLCGLQGTTKDIRAKQSHLMELQKIKMAQPTKSLMIATLKLTVMMVTMEMTRVVVPRHLPH
jgi:hypothetical protein